MAMVLDAFVSYIDDLLNQVEKEEPAMLLGVSDEIDQLGCKLQHFKNFLADANRRSINDGSVQMWAMELKRAMYDATDILDTCQLNAMEQGKSVVQGGGCFNPLLLCMRNPDYAHGIGSRIKALNQKLDTLMAQSAGMGFIKLGYYENHGSEVHDSRLAAVQETSWKLHRSAVVGKIQEDTRALVETMLERTEENSPLVFAVVGAGGIGKTTLAQMVFNSEAIQWEFDKKIWLNLNQNINEVEMLKRAITEAGGNHRPAGNLVTELLHIFRDAIIDKKVFLVMDNVWNATAFNMLKVPISYAASGSRVLITTRFEMVSRGMKAVFVHHVDTLWLEDAWTLLKRQVISSEIDELKDIGMQIIERCDGLPLSVKVMGGLLCQRGRRRRDWEMVLNVDVPEELNYAIFLSYEDLSPGLKQCFLHYSRLPQSAIFNNDDIVGMWISEGFVQGNWDELEELGNKYYKELVSRKLIEPDLEYSDQYVCTMHDVTRSFAHFVSRDEAISAYIGETGTFRELSSEVFFRLFLECEGLQWSRFQANKSLRTLISVGHMKIQPDDSLISFPCLRTLHMKYANFAILVESLYQLKHLRYLAIQGTDVSKLPENIGRLKFLQHINLLGCESLVKLPDSIVKLGQLRYLNLNSTSINDIPKGFSGLINLRKLFGFPTHTNGEWCSLEELGPLSHLRALGLEGLKNVCATSSAAKAQLGEKVHLTKLHLRCNNASRGNGLVQELERISEESMQRIKEVFDELCPPPCLEYLCIEGYFDSRLPRWMMSTSVAPLKSLRTLMMDDLACCTQLPDGLCQLPCLQLMQINRAPAIKRIGPEFVQAYHPSQLLEVAFPRLNKMVLDGMVGWEEWKWEEQVQAMPILEELHLNNCNLRCVPPGLPSQARALKRLLIGAARSLVSLENFASIVELHVGFCPKLRCISYLARLQNLTVAICPKLNTLIGVPALRRLLLEDYDMRTLPEYMGNTKPSHFLIDCSLELLTSIAAGQSGSEWHKFCHIHNVKAYAHDGDNRRKWYVQYTANPCNLETNITHPTLLAAAVGRGEDEFVGSDQHELVGTDSSRESAVALREGYDEIVAVDSPSRPAVARSKDDGELVGIDSLCKDIIKVLMHSEGKRLKKVSICGVGGLGKTTIAKAVYRQIKNGFDCRAFVTVPHSRVKNDDIIRSISDQINCPSPGLEECDTQLLIDGLTLFLQDRRYMIVLDDVSAMSVLDLIMPAFSGNNHGSKLIVTTRNIDVAGYVGGVYVPPLMSYHCSKKLFYTRTIFGSEDRCPSQFIEFSKRMLRKCSGLPLAIIAVTNLLPSRIALEDWQMVCDSIEFGDGMKGIREVVLSCYDDLPQRLKNCLLYLSIFPEDYKIRRDCLVQRWIAEDLIHGDHGQNLQELGERYFYELINTSMVQAVEFDSCGDAVVCCVPVLVLQLIVHLSIKGNFVTILPHQQQADVQDKVQRLSLQASKEQHDVLQATKTVGQVSSLSIFSGADLMQPLSKFQELRLLDLECDSVKNEHLNSLGNLHKLRYLVLGSSGITEIPKKIWKLRNLQTLDLTESGVKELPYSIVKLTQLRRLHIKSSTEVPDGIIGKLQALEELVHVDISKSPSILEDISTLPEMRVLSLALWSWDERHSTLLPEGLRKLTTKKLKQLSIFSCCLLDLKSDLQPVLEQLEKLEIQGSIFDTLPKWIDQLAHLRSLSVEVYTLKNDDLRILGKLSHLLFLSLAAKRSLGEKLVIRDEISSLETFHLFDRSMAIKFEQGAMGRLQRLKLMLQASLTENFSFGLENLSSLKHVEVEIICFSATDDSVNVAEAAITSKIRDNPSEPTLEITRTEEKYMIEDKKREAGCEIKIEDQEALRAAKKKSRKARKKNKRKH